MVARLAIDKDFLDDYSRLEKSVQFAVKAAMEKFSEHTHAGIHLEKINKAKDERLRTIRIDQFWRGVVMAPESGDTYYLLKVMPHDKALAYAASHRLSVNQVLGVVEVRDQDALDQIQPALEHAAQAAGGTPGLLAHVSDADLTRLGIDANTRMIARLLTSEAHLEAMLTMIPETQYNALVGLAAGQAPEEVWAEISQYAPSEAERDRIDADDMVKAMERTPGKVVFIDDSDELDRILKHPFALWRTFLHPAQRKIAYARQYAGPVQVTGGAGTGKTVTAMHRAVHLARQALAQLPANDRKPILLTTFTRNLADSLQAQFGLLADMNDADTAADIRSQVDILNVDRLAYQIVAKARGRNPAPIDGKELIDVWAVKVKEAGLSFTPSFLEREWRQVILAQGLSGEQEYLTCSRAGQGAPLGKAQRRQVWAVAREVQAALTELGRDTFLQLADEAARVLRQAPERPYRHVIIDEAQDLHPAQWRLLRACVATGPDDMFIVGDPHQRIYDNHVSLSKMAINVRGRSKRLKVNYRTTQEILTLAVPALGKGPITGLDDEADTLDGYRSPLHGRRPKVIPARTREAELTALVKQVRAWLDDGIEPHAIGVAARAGYLWKEASDALHTAGIPVAKLSASAKTNGVRLGSMHGMKGLEFQAVAVIGVSDGIVPAPNAVTPESEDPVAHAQDLQRERCLLFVACTRARDYLYVSYSGAPSPFLAQS
jgi:superfamily I DNA/RNA helicase